jgi:hypothetical protein
MHTILFNLLKEMLAFCSLIWWMGGGTRVMVFNTFFNNVSVISWWSVLLVQETGIPEENH